jgi:small-conductance mechanosensitive channel
VTSLLTKYEDLKDPFLRAAEDAGEPEKAKVLGELRKEAGLERAAPDAAAAASAAATPASAPRTGDSGSLQASLEGPAAGAAAAVARPTPLQKAVSSLQDFQQLISGRLRVLDDQAAVGKDVVGAIGMLEKAEGGYQSALADARQAELMVHVVAIDLKKRVGRGELTGDQLPAGVADALKPEVRAKLDGDAAELLATIQRLRQMSESLQKQDPVAEDAKAKTRQVLKLVGQRLDLLADLGRLESAYDQSPKDRDPGEARRLVEEAAERQDTESSTFDTLLAIDTSKRATGLADLLESDYHDLIELELKEDNLRQQREIAAKLVDLAQQEQTTIASVLPVLENQVKLLEEARDQEVVLAKARLRPDQADELLKTFAVSTGRQLAKPLPVGEKEKPDKVVEMAGAIFEKGVAVVAGKNWAAALSARLAPGGIKSEAGVYQDEVARANADSGGNCRRIEGLTGQELPAPGTSEAAAVTSRQKYPVVGGSIANTRAELAKTRRHGVIIIAIKIALVVLAAIFVPFLLRPLLRRALGPKAADDEHGNTSLVVSAMGTFVRTAVWIVAIALILSVLGFDITAIVAGLGIGGLAIGLAAQPMISDVIGSIIIFAERKFSIGDVIRIGEAEPAKVVGLSWRGTQLKGFDGQVINVPNRNVTTETIRNLTKDGRSFDSVDISIKTEKDVAKVLAVIKQATEGCKHLAGDHGFVVKQYELAGKSRLIKYQFWWYLKDYDVRNQTRDEVFERISSSVLGADLAGTEITLA